MTERRDILRGIVGLTAGALFPARIHAQSNAKVRVTLVRWPYT
jgi:hypothetical protein